MGPSKAMRLRLIKRPGQFSPLLPEPVLFVQERLRQKGIRTYLVGGCIREVLMGREPIDWDLAVSCSMEDLRGILGDQVCYEFKQMVFSVFRSRQKVEISPLKGKDILEDLSKRDFTINALAYDLTRAMLLDPFRGILDLEKGIIRAVRDPLARIGEDPLRMLRAIRFMGELGFELDRGLLKAILAKARLLAGISQERIRDELKKVLLVRSPYRCLWYLFSLGLMSEILPEIEQLKGVKQSPPHRHRVMKHTFLAVEYTAPSLILRLAALFHDVAKPKVHAFRAGRHRFIGHQSLGARIAKEILLHLRFSNSIAEYVSHLVRYHLIFYDPSWSDKAVRRFLRKLHPVSVWEVLALRLADVMAQDQGRKELLLLGQFAERVKRLGGKEGGHISLQIDGHQIMEALGIPPGPMVGKILKGLRDWVAENPAENRKETLIRTAREIHRRLK
jgi:putative nucleotidyltransferase with HDIG domain